MGPGIHAYGAHTAAHTRDYGRQGEVRQIPPCFHSAILDFVDFRLHKIFCHAANIAEICHGQSRFHDSILGVKNGVQYRLVSGDYLKWVPELLL